MLSSGIRTAGNIHAATTASVSIVTTPGNVAMMPNSINTTPGNVTRTPSNIYETSGSVIMSPMTPMTLDNVISGDECLKGLVHWYTHAYIHMQSTSIDSTTYMKLIRKCVIPKIKEKWKMVAEFLGYSVAAVDNIKAEHK